MFYTYLENKYFLFFQENLIPTFTRRVSTSTTWAIMILKWRNTKVSLLSDRFHFFGRGGGWIFSFKTIESSEILCTGIEKKNNNTDIQMFYWQ